MGGITTSTWWLQWPQLFLISACLIQSKMGERRIDLGALGANVLDKLGAMLDNLTCGWRQLAHVVSEQPNLRYRWDIAGGAETCELIFGPIFFFLPLYISFYFSIWAPLEQLCLTVYLKTLCSPEGSIFSPMFTAPWENTRSWLGVLSLTWEVFQCSLWHHKELISRTSGDIFQKEVEDFKNLGDIPINFSAVFHPRHILCFFCFFTDFTEVVTDSTLYGLFFHLSAVKMSWPPAHSRFWVPQAARDEPCWQAWPIAPAHSTSWFTA